MKQNDVDVAIQQGYNTAMRNLLDRCGFARGVKVFLIELEMKASWWEVLLLRAVRRLVERTILGCEAGERRRAG